MPDPDSSTSRWRCLNHTQVLTALPPRIREYVHDVERRIGLSFIFQEMPAELRDRAKEDYCYDRGPRIRLTHIERYWGIAHEAGHAEAELLRGFPVFSATAERPDGVDEARSVLQSCVNDEAVHMRLAGLGLRVREEVIGDELFDCFRAISDALKRGNQHPYDRMAHLDKLGRGKLWRAKFLIHAVNLRTDWADRIPERDLGTIVRFEKQFCRHRKEERRYAKTVLRWFRMHDLSTPSGSGEVLRRWADLEHLGVHGQLVRYERTGRDYVLVPFS